jgi:hypothetical protein
MICRIYLFAIIAGIFINTPKACGNYVAIFKSIKIATITDSKSCKNAFI